MKYQNALIIGYGSSGKRYARILKKKKNIKDIFIVSKNKNCAFKRYEKLSKIKILNFDIIIIASKTDEHYEHLKFLDQNFKNKKIIVEKPLFSNQKNFNLKNNKVFVGYNLRFDPMITYLKKMIDKEKEEIIFSDLKCLSYLPSWKKNNSYKKSYSSFIKQGGGVTKDLSHEIDLGCYLFGLKKLNFAANAKKSPLEIETDDFSYLLGQGYKNSLISISLNYYFHKEVRQIFLSMKKKSFVIDLISRKIIIKNNFGEKLIKFKKIKDESYSLLIDDVINNKKKCCSFKEGLKINKIIAKFKTI